MKIDHPGLRLAALFAATVPVVTGQAIAQASPSPYTAAVRYDAVGRIVGTIAPDPDGAGPLKYAAIRNSYDGKGLLTKVETGELSAWQSESVAPANWSGFTLLSSVEYAYDNSWKKTSETKRGSDGNAYGLIQYSYTSAGWLECTAVRMNPAAYGSLPASACTLGTEGSNGPDRITRNIYDDAGQLIQVREGVGTPFEAAEATYGYTGNGKRAFVIDANGNRAQMTYDGFDRQVQWTFPSPTQPAAFNDYSHASAVASAGSPNASDYEQYGYDANGNRTSLRKRDGSTLTYSYDALNRMTVKVVPERSGLTAAQTRDVYYDYNANGLMTKARFDSLSGEGVTNDYNGFGDLLTASISMNGLSRTLAYQYDSQGNRTRVTHPDAVYFSTIFDQLGRAANATWTIGPYTVPFMAITYANHGRRSNFNIASSWTAYGYDPVGRLTSMPFDFVGTAADVSYGYSYNPASQMASQSRDNDEYAWAGAAMVNRDYATNGLNQYVSAGPASFTYDPNGNLTSDGSTSFVYDVENRLVSASGAKTASLVYDPLGRLFETSGGTSGVTRFLYDGDKLAIEYDELGAIKWRYYFGPNVDEPLLADPGGALNCEAGTRFLHADHQGSIVALADCWGNRQAVNSYDEYGIPAAANQGRFQYTGQIWLPELGMYHYKARLYSPTLGRFLQVDPIGYDDQVNLYAYVGNDPMNATDPSGMEGACFYSPGQCNDYGPHNIGANLELVGNLLQGFAEVANALPDGFIIGKPVGSVGRSLEAMAKPAAKFFGKAQATSRAGTPLGHAHASARAAREMAVSGKYVNNTAYLNRQLSTITGGQIKSALRPDVAAIRPDGKVDVTEVLSRGQSAATLRDKYAQALGDKMGTFRAIEPKVPCTGTRILGTTC